MEPYLIIERIGAVAYRLELPAELEAFHDVFHVSVLRKVVAEKELIIPQPPKDLELDLSVKGRPVSILSRRDGGSMGKKARTVQICWERDGIQEVTWETEQHMRQDYPELFTEDSGVLNSGTNSLEVGENCETRFGLAKAQ
ncbi:unnamed protein product [Microthlaspi erraticum]|uniref:Tf2-1-like SH3-like domain-containing protein n=1 Tax=Microthlaspi erraticum TaxID=1685480 RepID=A0A6D2L3L4_9BRAS|nr:unnamed protein product [Microthlaspi erraticum]